MCDLAERVLSFASNLVMGMVCSGPISSLTCLAVTWFLVKLIPVSRTYELRFKNNVNLLVKRVAVVLELWLLASSSSRYSTARP